MSNSIFFIGAGAVGGSLATALSLSGCPIVGICDRNVDQAAAIARATNAVSFAKTMPSAIRQADIVLVAVPDSLINQVAKQAASRSLAAPSQVWLHVSGSLGAQELEPLAQFTRGVGAFHPAVVFPPAQITSIPTGTRFAVDGNEAAWKASVILAHQLKGKAVQVPGAIRTRYHAAMVMSSNYVVALLSQAALVLSRAGLPPDEIESIVTSLAASAVESSSKQGIARSLSGPIQRGDAQTVTKHMDVLAGLDGAREIYQAGGKITLDLAKDQSNLTESQITAIAQALDIYDAPKEGTS